MLVVTLTGSVSAEGTPSAVSRYAYDETGLGWLGANVLLRPSAYLLIWGRDAEFWADTCTKHLWLRERSLTLTLFPTVRERRLRTRVRMLELRNLYCRPSARTFLLSAQAWRLEVTACE